MPVELGQVASLADVILQDHYELIVAVVPGGGDGQSLNIRNLSTSLPGRKNSPVNVELHRHKVHFAGKRSYGNSLPASFIESSDRKTWAALLNWQNQMTDPATGLPRPKSDYATTGIIKVYDSNNAVVEERTLYGLFITDLADAQLSGQANSPLNVTCTLNYDFWS